ncbi:thiamine-phosphate kinase [Flocculibacter collagenilyticus]|uniref:thiamine-phosphate kinase n=1 Tax=Flocculibacter collagenilyticus TaxID=2744479 RepID=UPI0018F34117|nr:thiamine-phosphate kinase [Flocculibacter collagenilyticus]
MKEFDVIRTYFTNRGASRKDVVLRAGDDAAVVKVAAGNQVVITTDMLCENVHFFSSTPARAIGHRAVAANLSDLAAMGATPAWISMALSIPSVDEEWLKEFSDGVFEVAEYYNVEVVGGDTTQGPLTITICAKGLVPDDTYLTRCGAKPGDWIYVTGSLGDAGVAIESINGKVEIEPKHKNYLMNRFEYPTPRVAAGEAIRGIASSAIDVSDGITSDLQHILTRSKVSAEIDVEKLPMSKALLETVGAEEALRYALSYGDDYELLFTVPEDKKGGLDISLSQFGLTATCIGQIKGGDSKLQLTRGGTPFIFNHSGFEHFSQK